MLAGIVAGAFVFGASIVAAAAQPGFGGGAGPIGPGGGGPGGAPGGPGGRQKKKEGPAEAAPKDKEALRPIEAVPAQPQRFRRIQLFELNGYLRVRGDYFHRLGLGLPETILEGERPNKFFEPPAESSEFDERNVATENDASCGNRLSSSGVNTQRAAMRCNRRHGFASANMRLRLEPTLHITDTVRVHSQIDILDNLVLGSTPDSFGWDNPYAPIDLYSRTQTPPTSGINSFRDSIVAKRAWGHIKFGFGLDLRFGRMPWHWGMGMVANHGNGYVRGDSADIIRQVDQDYGDSVDSVRLAFDFGKDRRKAHTIAISWDWASSGPTTGQLLGPKWDSGGIIGQDFSAEKFDNVYQWSISLERRDDMDMLRRKVSLGTPVVNYGFMNWLRYQDVDNDIGSPGLGDGLGTNPTYYSGDNNNQNPDPLRTGGAPLGNGDLDSEGRTGFTNYASTLMHRRAFMYTPDLWLRVNWRTLRIEFEAAGQIGTFRMRDDIDTLVPESRADFDTMQRADLDDNLILAFGYALEFKYGFFRDRFHIGFDHGFATGDTSPPLQYNPQSPLLSGNTDRRLDNFRFNPAYNIDLLLFREILGTVSNAAYFKPWAAFYFFQHFSVRADVMYALAMRPQSTLGNRYSYGVEIDGAARYHDAREPIFFQLQYGVMFPLPAFNRLRAAGGADDARAVQTLQAQVGIKF
ncbi:MAG TPA: TIGR04551 family protein [Nannocystaceae bacterium]|nr:TIGR04551 family protein [Nannocystaceae bacterium]